MAKGRKKAAKKPLPADEVVVSQNNASAELPLGDCKCDCDTAFVENLVNEAKALTKSAADALSGRIDDLEKKPAPASKRGDASLDRLEDVEEKMAELEERMTAYDLGGAKYPKDTREYVVEKGDKMVLIAKKLLSNPGLFSKIAMWNYDRYPSLRANSNDVDEGWTLRIPPE